MAILHHAELTPSKLQLLGEWMPTQPWFAGDISSELVNVAAFRFDDPAGEVGVETILVSADGGPIMQVPLTYRGAPLEGAESALIRTMEHSVLGKRWVYDGIADPVYLQTVATVALNGGHEAEQLVESVQGRTLREPNARVSGSGSSARKVKLPSPADVTIGQDGSVTIVDSGALHVRIQRVVGGDSLRTDASHESALLGTWTGSDSPQELVAVALS